MLVGHGASPDERLRLGESNRQSLERRRVVEVRQECIDARSEVDQGDLAQSRPPLECGVERHRVVHRHLRKSQRRQRVRRRVQGEEIVELACEIGRAKTEEKKDTSSSEWCGESTIEFLAETIPFATKTPTSTPPSTARALCSRVSLTPWVRSDGASVVCRTSEWPRGRTPPCARP